MSHVRSVGHTEVPGGKCWSHGPSATQTVSDFTGVFSSRALRTMYTITRGPSKLVTQRRTGPSQQLDNKINEFKHKQTSWSLPELPAPKIIFTRPNGKKYHHPAPALSTDDQQEETFTAAHEENVKFACEAWQEVMQQERGSEEDQGVVHFKETAPSPHMDNFVPIDLDEWWAQRFLANIDKQS